MDMDSTLGAIEIGTLLSGGAVWSDHGANGLVLGLWIIELAHTACVFDALYMYTIKSYGDPASLIKFPIALDVTILLHGATVIIVQLFFTHRMAKFMKNKLWIPLIAAGVLIVRFVVFIVTGGAATMMSNLEGFMQQWMSLILFDLVSCALTDVAISAILVYQLAIRRKTAYKRLVLLLFALYDKLIMWSVETCLVTTITTMVMLVCFLTMKNNFVWVGILLVQPKIFSNALLANLNSRTSLRSADSEVHEFTPNSIKFKRPTGSGVLVTQESTTIKDGSKISATSVDLAFPVNGPDSPTKHSLVQEGLTPTRSVFENETKETFSVV
ncbi:Retinol dehydrogenase 12 [Mycena sanguinolenta]|uniref:Retinol dehydrogenase 12 n=1 Tax=Mycena sanguinolenta TaxID=230812 RepID=A0A8H6Z7A0_9AGAR|nr:Retinol dehydrogenase 12 [Mycena sanguinolenta]